MTEPAPMDGATEAGKPKHWGLGDVVGAFVTSFALSALAVAISLVVPLHETVELVVVMCATYLGMLGWVFAATYSKGSRSLRDDFGWGFRPGDIVRGIGALIGTIIVLALLSAVVWRNTEPDPTISLLQPASVPDFVLIAAVVVVVAPITEELFFRGLFLRSVERRLGAVGALIVTSVVFGLVHVPQRSEIGFVVAFLPITIVGAVLGWLAIRTRRLGASIVAHMAFNAIAAAVWATRL